MHCVCELRSQLNALTGCLTAADCFCSRCRVAGGIKLPPVRHSTAAPVQAEYSLAAIPTVNRLIMVLLRFSHSNSDSQHQSYAMWCNRAFGICTPNDLRRIQNGKVTLTFFGGPIWRWEVAKTEMRCKGEEPRALTISRYAMKRLISFQKYGLRSALLGGRLNWSLVVKRRP